MLISEDGLFRKNGEEVGDGVFCLGGCAVWGLADALAAPVCSFLPEVFVAVLPLCSAGGVLAWGLLQASLLFATLTGA